MAITSLDIQNQSFSIDRKGYDVDEVDVFLEHVANEIDMLNDQIADLTRQLDDAQMAGFDEPVVVEDDFEEVEDATVAMDAIVEDDAEEVVADPAEIADLKAEIADLKAQLKEKSSNDSAISQALVVAQRTADNMVADAKLEAEQIVADADDEAARILTKAETDRQKVQDAINTLEEEREQVRVNYRDMLNDFMDDAERKLSAIDLDARKSAQAKHTAAAAPAAAPVSAVAANYQVPTNIGAAAAAPAAPAQQGGFFEKDFSGFGDVEADFDFTDPD